MECVIYFYEFPPLGSPQFTLPSTSKALEENRNIFWGGNKNRSPFKDIKNFLVTILRIKHEEHSGTIHKDKCAVKKKIPLEHENY